MIAWLDFDVLILFGADLTKLESGSHLTVNLILFLCDADVVFFRLANCCTQVRVYAPTIGI